MFLLLLGISLALTIQSHSYHKSKVIGAANLFSGTVNQEVGDVDKYLSLVSKNDSIAQENAKLLSILFNKKDDHKPKIDSIFGINGKNLVVSKIIRNSYNLQKNDLTINSGAKDSIKVDMGVVNDLGIIGVIDRVSKNYAIVTSILNTETLINAKIKNSNYFGTLSWNGKNTDFSQLFDVPRTTTVRKGDTIQL